MAPYRTLGQIEQKSSMESLWTDLKLLHILLRLRQINIHALLRPNCSCTSAKSQKASLDMSSKQQYSETSLIRHSMGPENNVGLGGCRIMECLLPYISMVDVRTS